MICPPLTQMLATATLGLALCAASAADAEDLIRPRLIGTWKVVNNYDQFPDGTTRNTWGSGSQGQVIFAPEGTFAAIIVSGDRQPKPGTVPTDPVGPVIAYAGTFSVDEAGHAFTTKVAYASFPPWQGQTLLRKVEALDADQLKVVAAPITDPTGRQYVPHLELMRVK